MHIVIIGTADNNPLNVLALRPIAHLVDSLQLRESLKYRLRVSIVLGLDVGESLDLAILLLIGVHRLYLYEGDT